MTNNKEEAELVEQYNRVSEMVQDLFNKVVGTDAKYTPITDVKDIPSPLIKIVTE